MTPEGRVVKAIRETVKEFHGFSRKVKWVGQVGAPDLFVCIGGQNFFIEVKAPGQRPEPHQVREHARMRAAGGCTVLVIDNVDLGRAVVKAAAGGRPLQELEAWCDNG